MISWRSILTGLGALALAACTLPLALAAEPDGLFKELEGFGAVGGEGDLKVSAQIIRGPTEGSALLQVRVEVTEGWHTYSVTQPADGPKATTIVVAPPARLAGPFVPDHPPKRKTSALFPVPMEEHEGTIIWTAPLEVGGTPLDQLRVAGTLDGQVCQGDNKCIQIAKPFTAEFNADAKVAPAGLYEDRASNLVIRGQIEPGGVAPGGKAKLTLTFEPNAGWHVYVWKAVPAKKVDNATLIVVTEKGGLTFGDPATASKVVAKEDVTFHEGPVTWTLEISVPADAKPGPHEIAGQLAYLVCSDKTCLPPSGARFHGTLTVGEANPAPALLSFSKSKYNDAVEAIKALAVAPESKPSAVPLPWIIVAALVGGFILNLMPCVLPVIGLKVLSFAEQAGQSRMQVLALNLWYSLGVLVVFWILAGMAVFLNLAWGEQFQATWFNVLMTGVVFAMGLSFLGVWEIPVPGFATSDKASDLADNEGALGAFFKGILTTVLSTPCSGPLLGAVFSYLVTQSPYVSFLVFTCIGLGMASPYILVGLEPSLIRFIPKPGEWMNTFKHVMGFIMMGAAVLLLASVAKDYRIATLTFLVGLSASCWLIGRIPAGSEWPETIQGWSYASALSILIALASFGYLGPNEFELPWKKWEPARAETLAKEGKTVLVDFTADWCLTCKANLKFAINTKAVSAAVKEKGVVPLLADWTTPDEEIKAALLRLDNSRSIPVLAIYPAGKPEEVIILRDLVTQAAVLEALEKAGPSQKGDDPKVALGGAEGERTE